MEYYKNRLHWLFFDVENIGGLKELRLNTGYFLNRILGGRQKIEPAITNNFHAHFLNRLLVIPFIAGIARALRSKKDSRHILLLLLSLAIYLTPLLLTSSRGYKEARRSLLYVIPTYLFIGLGVDAIFNFVKSLSAIIVKRTLRLLIFIGITFVILGELLYVETYIIKNSRDLGILKFASGINKLGIQGDVYYFELNVPPYSRVYDFSLYGQAKESDILRVALMDKRGNFPHLTEINASSEINPSLKSFYLAKSPLISEEEFEAWCKRGALTFKLLFDSPVINFKDNRMNPRQRDTSFKLYFIVRQP